MKFKLIFFVSFFIIGCHPSPVEILSEIDKAQNNSFSLTFEAEDLQINQGEKVSDGVVVETKNSQEGNAIYGPYYTKLDKQSYVAFFKMQIDSLEGASHVATVEVYDHTSEQIISQRDVNRSDFDQPFQYQEIPVWFDNKKTFGHSLEFRL